MDGLLAELKDRCRENLLPYTVRAFSLLPKMESPTIADIGCGTGVPTLELARLSDGMIYAVDTDNRSLGRLGAEMDRLGFRDRIRIINGSIDSPELPANGIDILWAEGLFNVIGFEKGISASHVLLKTGGFLVIHDEIAEENEKRTAIEKYGFSLMDSFVLNSEVWWDRYYSCLEKGIVSLSPAEDDKYGIEAALLEIGNFRKNPGQFRSIFYLLRKTRQTTPPPD